MSTHLALSEFGRTHAATSRPPDPERSLMMAVLEDAIDCIDRCRLATYGPPRRVFEEERRWFLDEDARWPYSFASICETLDLDANAVRESLGLVTRGPKIRVGGHTQRHPARAEASPKPTGSSVG